MKWTSVTEGKRDFTCLVGLAEKGESIGIRRRKKPVAVLIPPLEYDRLRKVQAFLKMIELSQELSGGRPSIQEIYEESRRMMKGEAGETGN
jgi:prevent-host-death family protein